MQSSHNHLVTVLLLALLISACGTKKDAADEMAELHSGDTPAQTGMAQEPTVEVTAQDVVYGTIDGKQLTGYLVSPANSESADLPGVIMIHEWWGLNDNIRTTARRLAGEGYRVLAVDLYDGKTGSTPEEAQSLMRAALADQASSETNLVAAHAYLSENANAPKVGVIGWCFGGGQSLNAALRMPSQIDATVIYYGPLTTDKNELATLEMPVLGFFGSEDGGIPVSMVREFETNLNDLGKSVKVTVYEGAGHAFANPSGQNYVEDAAADSWKQTTEFFDMHLKS